MESEIYVYFLKRILKTSVGGKKKDIFFVLKKSFFILLKTYVHKYVLF